MLAQEKAEKQQREMLHGYQDVKNNPNDSMPDKDDSEDYENESQYCFKLRT